jgi:hypothetical protein
MRLGQQQPTTSSSSASAYYSPLLDIGLSNVSPSRSIFGYSYPAPASRYSIRRSSCANRHSTWPESVLSSYPLGIYKNLSIHRDRHREATLFYTMIMICFVLLSIEVVDIPYLCWILVHDMFSYCIVYRSLGAI